MQLTKFLVYRKNEKDLLLIKTLGFIINNSIFAHFVHSLHLIWSKLCTNLCGIAYWSFCRKDGIGESELGESVSDGQHRSSSYR